jgi:spoIIIJ-associated protein
MGDNPSVNRGKQWLERVTNLAGIVASISAEVKETFDEKSCWLTIDDTALTPSQIDALIGERGHVIDALQYLANATLNIGVPESEQGAYTIDLAGYRGDRHRELERIAEVALAAVHSTGEEYEIPGLSAAERRQMHHLLKTSGDVETISRGQEPDRRLVLRPLASQGDFPTD